MIFVAFYHGTSSLVVDWYICLTYVTFYVISDGLDIAYMFDYDLKTKDGKQYIDENIRPSVTFTMKNANFQFDNLFQGDKTLGKKKRISYATTSK